MSVNSLLPPSYDRNPPPPAHAFNKDTAPPATSQGLPSSESHTLGNALKNVILQNPAVTFCGYSIPHPAEDQMFLRIQTVDDVPAQDVLKKGLQDLKIICGMTRQTFNQEMKKFEAKSQR
ncbi:probable DNA-directed RNA polymerases I and III subunit RPAC2 [Tigriopus californicus]|uniref:probable DNA-directed RNA polymerases I and III subunit RPAC2 n=1 Tax=Tigriopus californicus TaxID=6832 RepID=UPI0027DA6AAA|nr:probable DNA-directed RNA polymerases I and III subunit RPAC2 [Tigriopus californicus]